MDTVAQEINGSQVGQPGRPRGCVLLETELGSWQVEVPCLF